MKSFKNNTKNSIWDEDNLFRFVLNILKINNRLALMINGMKRTHVRVVMSIFLTLPFTLPFSYTILSYHTDTYLKEFSWKSIVFKKNGIA